ncbi:MAG: hypothetical protein QXX81_08395 [Zestosphaera sp.]
MKFVSEIPPELLSAERKEDVILFLMLLPCDEYTKKYMFLEWCEYVGIKATAEDIKRITAGRLL